MNAVFGGDVMGASTHNAYLHTQKSHLELKEEFVVVDRDADGTLDCREFSEFIHHVDTEMGETIINLGFVAIDADRDGRIAFAEFLSWWRAL